MSIETIIIIVSAALILYELKRIANCLTIRERVNSPTDNSVKSENDYEKYNALYPVFSEQTVNYACKMFSKYHNELGSKWEQLRRLEHTEAKKHHELGMGASTFNPSSLSSLLQEIDTTAIYRNDTENDLKNMIETNIRVINGTSIEQARQEYYSHQGIYQENINRSNMVGSLEGLWHFTKNSTVGDIGKLREDFVEDRKEYWRERWEDLIKKDVDEE